MRVSRADSIFLGFALLCTIAGVMPGNPVGLKAQAAAAATLDSHPAPTIYIPELSTITPDTTDFEPCTRRTLARPTTTDKADNPPMDAGSWEIVIAPGEGVITPGANIYDFAVGSDSNTIYAVGSLPARTVDGVNGITIALWKSSNGGTSWADRTAELLKKNVSPNLPTPFAILSQVAVSPTNAYLVAVAGMDGAGNPMVVTSNDGATNFYYSSIAGVTGDIVCLDVSHGVDDIYDIAFGTNAGKLWRSEVGTFWAGWEDATDAANYPGWTASTAVLSLAFSPNWRSDKTVLAISTDGSKTWLQTAKWGTNKGWGAGTGLPDAVELKLGGASIAPITIPAALGLPTSHTGVAGIALPSDYTGNEPSSRRVYAYVDATSPAINDGGYLFRIDNTTLTVPNAPTGNPWLASIAYRGGCDGGDTMLGMLGNGAPGAPAFTECCEGIQVYSSSGMELCGTDWCESIKPPTGRAYALAAFAPDGRKAYVTTVGSGACGGGAFSISLSKDATSGKPAGTTDVSGMVSSSGVFASSVTASSADGVCQFAIDKDTRGLTIDGNCLEKISIVEMPEPPAPPADASIIGAVYDFGPDGASFEPASTLIFTYDPSSIPEDIAVESLSLAYRDAQTESWVRLDSTVDTTARTVTALISHFTAFAVLGFKPAPAAFECSSLDISPHEISVGENISISVLVSNTGELAGNFELSCKIDNAVVESKEITLAGGASQEVIFSVPVHTVGTYEVDIDGLSGSFSVKQEPAPEPTPHPAVPQGRNWWQVIGIIAAVAVAGSATYMVIRRRRRV